jgi:ABC transporter, phosphonate, periplasmic substrate-binding protein
MRIGVVLGSLLLAAPVLAGSHDFVIQHAGSGGNTQSAQGYIDQFLRYAEGALKWPANSAKGEFFTKQAEAKAFIDQAKPGFGILDAPVFLDLQKSDDLVVIASVEGTNQLSGHLSVLVKDPKLKSLADLKGKKILSNHVDNPRFVSTIVFRGALGEKDVTFEQTPSAFKGPRTVSAGGADATLVSDTELAAMNLKQLGLQVIYKSPTLPPTPVVALGKNSTPAEREAFTKMLMKMCGDPKGSEVCKALEITKFTPPDKAAYDDALRRYAK